MKSLSERGLPLGDRNNYVKYELMYILNQYCCQRCGSSDHLQFDHVNGNGMDDRSVRRGREYYLNNPNLARKYLQVLCRNCNVIKGIENMEISGIRKVKKICQTLTEKYNIDTTKLFADYKKRYDEYGWYGFYADRMNRTYRDSTYFHGSSDSIVSPINTIKADYEYESIYNIPPEPKIYKTEIYKPEPYVAPPKTVNVHYIDSRDRRRIDDIDAKAKRGEYTFTRGFRKLRL